MEALYFVNFTIRYIALWAFHVLFIIFCCYINVFLHKQFSHSSLEPSSNSRKYSRTIKRRGEATEHSSIQIKSVYRHNKAAASLTCSLCSTSCYFNNIILFNSRFAVKYSISHRSGIIWNSLLFKFFSKPCASFLEDQTVCHVPVS